MKYNQYLSTAFAIALSAFGMVSCSEDVAAPNSENVRGEKVHMSINVSLENLALETKGEFNTDENGKLKFSWDSSDVIEVRGKVYGTMYHLGTLTLNEGTGNGSVGNFSGDVELIGETGEYHFYYLGSKTVGENDTECVFNLPYEDKTLAGLAKSDVQRAKATLTYASNGLIGDVSLSRAFGFLTVTVNLPENVNTPTEGAVLTFTGRGISSEAVVSLADAESTITNRSEEEVGSVSLNMPGGVNTHTFYMNILPGTLANLTVTTTIDGVNYTASLLSESTKETVANKNYKTTFNLKSSFTVIGHMNGGNGQDRVYTVPNADWSTTVSISDFNTAMNALYGEPTRLYYKFLGWTNENETETLTDVSFTYPTTTRDIYAKWEQKKYDVTVEAYSGYGENKLECSVIEEDKTLTYNFNLSDLDDPAEREGYTFVGWSESVNGTVVEYVTFTEDVENPVKKVYAVWRDNNVTVSGNVTIGNAKGSEY